jgi:hypothetical protein
MTMAAQLIAECSLPRTYKSYGDHGKDTATGQVKVEKNLKGGLR